MTETYNLLGEYIDFGDYHRKMESFKSDYLFFSLYIEREKKSHRDWELQPKRMWWIPELIKERLTYSKKFDSVFEDLFMIELAMEQNSFDKDELKVISKLIRKLTSIETKVVQIERDRYTLHINLERD